MSGFDDFLPIVFAAAFLLAFICGLCCSFDGEERADAEQRESLEQRAARALAEQAAAAATAAAVLAEQEAAAAVAVQEAAAAARPVVLPFFPYAARGGRAPAETRECAICLEPLRQGQLCSEVPACRHVFHRDCLGVWARSNGSCPLCRAKIAPGSVGVAVAEDMV